MILLEGWEKSGFDSLRFPSLPSPFGITCDGIVAFDLRPK